MLEVQSIFQRFGSDYLKNHPLSPVQAKAFRAICNCRTAGLGAHLDTCDHCGFVKISYNSCRNRHCPKCQAFAREQWIEKQNSHRLNTNYFHVVFTLPEELNAVFLRSQKTAYTLFFHAVSQTLLELCASHTYLGAVPGITAVLHTWGQNLMYHPHIHCIVTGGGLTGNGKWRTSRKKFFLPAKVLSRKFRGKLLSFLKQAGFSFPSNLYHKEWVVYCKPPFKSVGKVIEYLGRYTHRIAISNSRLLQVQDSKVSFSWRDYRDHSRKKVMTLSAAEFIRRFMLHVLPPGFCKIRHFGIFAPRDKSARMNLCRKLTATSFCPPKPASALDTLRKMLGQDFDRCPCCGIGRLARASPASLTI